MLTSGLQVSVHALQLPLALHKSTHCCTGGSGSEQWQ